MARIVGAGDDDAREAREAQEAARQEDAAKRAIKSEQDRLAFGKPTEQLEWDGIRKLDMPPPRWWVLTFWGCFVFAVVWWALYPSWPGTRTYFHGLLGSDQRAAVAEQIRAAEARRGEASAQIGAMEDLEQVRSDPRLLQYAIAAGSVVFANNCAPCHGLGGAGQGVFPSLADDDWLWGGTLDAIRYTVTHGIRNGQDAEARDSQMPRFGADQILTRAQIQDVTQYVLSLSDRADDPEAAARGEAVFAENCVACHGERGEGNQDMGAPRLGDAIWLYGGDAAAIARQIHDPRHGVMPPFGGRLDDATIKMVTLYVHSLGGGH